MAWYRVEITLSSPVSATSENEAVSKVMQMTDGPGHLRVVESVKEIGVDAVLVEDDEPGMSHSALVAMLTDIAEPVPCEHPDTEPVLAEDRVVDMECLLCGAAASEGFRA